MATIYLGNNALVKYIDNLTQIQSYSLVIIYQNHQIKYLTGQSESVRILVLAAI